MEKEAKAALKRAATKEMVPAIRAALAADIKHPGSHRGPAGNRGRKGPLERNVTARQVRKRSGELVAYGVGPRAWWAGWFIRGTKKHVITAKGLGLTASSTAVRSINKLRAGGYQSMRSNSMKARAQALAFSGVYRQQVEHPGTSGHDSVARAARGRSPAIQKRLRDDLFAHVSQSARKGVRR